MRPRRFILPQAGTGGYGIRSYVFEAAAHPHSQAHRDRRPCAGDAQGSVTRGVSEPGIIRKAKTKNAATLFYQKIAWLRFLWVFLLVENEICRGAFYMRPRRFILPQAGTGGYGIRSYVFEAAAHPHRGGAPRGVFSLWPKTKSVGAHSICARGGLSYRKRARADMESAPTFFVGTERGTFFPVACVGARPLVARQLTAATHFPGQFSCKASGYGRAMLAPTNVFWQSKPEIFLPAARFSPPPPAGGAPSQRGPREGGAPRGVFSLWPKTKSVGAHSICARGGLSYRKRARADMESAPTFLKRQSTSRHGGA